MKRLFLILFVVIVFSMTGCSVLKDSNVNVKELRCEYSHDPLGIDKIKPRLSWVLDSSERGHKQTAYQILVASSEAHLKADKGDLWETGKVTSNQSNHIVYDGKSLQSHMQCFWKVRVWDDENESSTWSKSAVFTMGLLKESDWNAKWIGSKDNLEIILLRREFDVIKPIARAYAYICGLGFYELHLNGKKVGDYVLDPGWTDYGKTCLYTTYDVTKYLIKGRNSLGVMLGNGMYNITGGRYTKFTGTFGPQKMIFQMHIEYTDGTSNTVLSDNSWRMYNSPIIFTCIFGGEDYDARLEQYGWDMLGFDDSSWKVADVVDGPGGRLVSQNSPPIKVMQVFKTVKITEPSPGVYVYDLGQNFSGWPQLTVKGTEGATVKMIPGELLDERGMVNQKNSGAPSFFQYTLKGKGTEVWHPRFTYYGFRYVQVEGATRNQDEISKGIPFIQDIEGHFVHSSAETVGSFSCSNKLFNSIHKIINAAVLSNLQSILTDCPHREKLGWLEVSHLMGPSIIFNYNVPLFYDKIINDMSEAQHPTGYVPTTAPDYRGIRGVYADAPAWGSAYVITPWYVYQRYNNKEVLEKHYEGMKKYVEYLGSRAEDNIISYGLGDWCDYGPKRSGFPQNTPVALTSTAIYYYDIKILQKTAEILGKPEEAEYYRSLAEEVNNTFNKKFFNEKADLYATGSQTSNAVPVFMGLADNLKIPALLEKLVNNIRSNNNHLTCGEVGLPFIIQTLNKYGRSNVVYDIASRRDVPSYGYQVEYGATTLTEAWDPNEGMSHNHCMLGHIEEWFYNGLAGINPDPNGVGFSKIIIKPQVVGDLKWIKGSYKSIYGEIISNWRIENGTLYLDITIPVNTTATVFIPAKKLEDITESSRPTADCEYIKFLRMESNAAVFTAGSGTYNFAVKR